jgi:carbonic anhydrase
MAKQSLKSSAVQQKNQKKKVSPDDALNSLIEGNKRFSQGLRSVDSMVDILQLQALAEKGQNPKAVILTCSDSRVPTETVFDQGVGDLYVLRVAGNVLSDIFLAGIEYSLTYFETPLILVLGHTKCGAVNAAFQQYGNPSAELPSPSLKHLVNAITSCHPGPKSEIELNWENVTAQVEKLSSESVVVKKNLKEGKLKIVGAIYDISTGKVHFSRDESSL